MRNARHLFTFDNSVWTERALLHMPDGRTEDFGKCEGLHCKFEMLVFPNLSSKDIELYLQQKLIGYDEQVFDGVKSLIINYVNNLKTE